MKDMETFGEYLKRERESRNISLEEIAQATKISGRYLKALEQDQFDLLPATTFTKGFIRAYARHIGLDAEDVILRYQDIFENQILSDQPGWRRGANKRWLFFIIGFGILIALVLAAGIMIWRSVQREDIRPERPHSMEILEEEAAQLRQLREELGLVSPPGPEPPAEGRRAQKGEDRLSGEPSAPSDVESGAKSESGGEAPPLALVDIEIQANALELTWIEVRVDDQPLGDVLLKKGEMVRWTGKESISLVIGNAGGVSLTLNNEPVGPLGPSGKVVRKVFTRETIASDLRHMD